MNANLFYAKLKILKLEALTKNIYKNNECYRRSLEDNRTLIFKKSMWKRILNLLGFSITFGFMVFLKSLNGVSRDAWNIIYLGSSLPFLALLTGNIVKTCSDFNRCEEEEIKNISSVIELSRSLSHLLAYFENRYAKMIEALDEDEKREYAKYLEEHQEEMDEIIAEDMNIMECVEMLNKILTGDANNFSEVFEKKEYEQTTTEYLNYLTITLNDYLIEQYANEAKKEENSEIDREKERSLGQSGF